MVSTYNFGSVYTMSNWFSAVFKTIHPLKMNIYHPSQTIKVTRWFIGSNPYKPSIPFAEDMQIRRRESRHLICVSRFAFPISFQILIQFIKDTTLKMETD